MEVLEETYLILFTCLETLVSFTVDFKVLDLPTLIELDFAFEVILVGFFLLPPVVVPWIEIDFSILT